MQFAKVNDIVVHYDLRWNGSGSPVLVFINSLGTDLRIWDEVRARLGNDVSTLVYDKRGHGLSDIGETPYTIELLAQDLIALLEYLAIHKAVICGLSVGGLIAQSVYAARPDLLAGLVLSNTAHKIGTPDMWDTRIAAIKQNGLASILDATMPRWFTASYRTPDNAAYRAYCNMFVRQPLEGYAATCAALREADQTAAVSQISVPVQCIAGDQDGSTPPALVQELASLIPGALFSRIDNSGHIPCVEQPDAYTALLRDFLTHTLPHGE